MTDANPDTFTSISPVKSGNSQLIANVLSTAAENIIQTGVDTTKVGNLQVSGIFTFTPSILGLQLNTISVTAPTGYSGVGWKTGNTTTILQYRS